MTYLGDADAVLLGRFLQGGSGDSRGGLRGSNLLGELPWLSECYRRPLQAPPAEVTLVKHVADYSLLIVERKQQRWAQRQQAVG